MSLAQLKDQAAHLQSAERRELIAFLVSLQTHQNDQFQSELSRKIDDKNLAHWVELDDLQKRYSD